MLKILNIVFFAGMIVMNYLANALPLNNKTTGQISDSLPNLFVPAGITFSIWAVIYLLLAGYCIVQFTGSGRTMAVNIGWLFALSCLLNALWIVFWHYGKLPLSLIIMAGMLITLIFINLLIRDSSFGLIKAAFGVYLGWICIATIANMTALLVHYNWNGFGLSHEIWTIILIITGGLIAAISLYEFRNPFIGLAVIWAFAGIILKRYDDSNPIVISAIITLLIVGILTIWVFFRKIPGTLN